MKKSYSKTLKKLIEFTDTKLIILGEILDYDASYISKWCSGAKLPSSKNIEEINEQLSTHFAKSIEDRDIILKFYNDFELPFKQNADFDDLKNNIYELLSTSFKRSVSAKASAELYESKVGMAIGNSNVMNELEKCIWNLMKKDENKTFNIWLSSDFYSMNTFKILNLFQNYSNGDKEINVLLSCPPEPRGDSEKLNAILYRLLCKYPDLNIELYENKAHIGLNYMLIIDKFVAYFSVDNNRTVQTMTYSFNLEIIEEYLHLLKDNYDPNIKILELIEESKMAETNYRLNFYSGADFIIYSAYGFEFLMPPEIVSEIAKYSREKLHKTDNYKEIMKLQIIWDELFNKANINFYVPKSTLYRYMEDGKIIYADVYYTLSPKQRAQHYKHIVNCLKKNPGIKIYLIDDYSKNMDLELKMFTMMYNKRQCFLKKVGGNESKKVSVIMDDMLMELVPQFVDYITDNFNYDLIDAETFKSLSHNYMKIIDVL